MMKNYILYIFVILIFSVIFEQYYNGKNCKILTETPNTNNSEQLLDEHNDLSEYILPEKKQNYINILSHLPLLNNYCFLPQKSSKYVWQPPEII